MRRIHWTREAQADLHHVERAQALAIFGALRQFSETGEGGEVHHLRPPDTECILTAGGCGVYFDLNAAGEIRIVRVLPRLTAPGRPPSE